MKDAGMTLSKQETETFYINFLDQTDLSASLLQHI